jgi:SAM-dependent methyltransferase
MFKKEGIQRVLDLGFGLGRHAILFAKAGFEVHGIDTSPAGLKFALQWSVEEKVPLQLSLGEMTHLPFPLEFFDLVIAWNVLYHGTLDTIGTAFGGIKKCLRPCSYLLCTLISRRHEKYGLGRELERGTFIIEEEMEKSHPHHYFDNEEIDHFLAGFSLVICEDREQRLPGSFHWHILARLDSKKPEQREGFKDR